jgi:hypothetical protein
MMQLSINCRRPWRAARPAAHFDAPTSKFSSLTPLD